MTGDFNPHLRVFAASAIVTGCPDPVQDKWGEMPSPDPATAETCELAPRWMPRIAVNEYASTQIQQNFDIKPPRNRRAFYLDVPKRKRGRR